MYAIVAEDYGLAIKFLELAANNLKKLPEKEDTQLLFSVVNNNLGLLYYLINDLESAEEVLLKSVVRSESEVFEIIE